MSGTPLSTSGMESFLSDEFVISHNTINNMHVQSVRGCHLWKATVREELHRVVRTSTHVAPGSTLNPLLSPEHTHEMMTSTPHRLN